MQEATDQLVLSNAVDQSISAIDFRPLTGKKVYLDTTYIRQIKGPGFVNADYITSSLRQQVVAAGCLLQDSPPDAELIIEARCGTLGADGHQTIYGIPANNAFSAATQILPSAPTIPSIPELSLARRESNEGAARIAAFAYDRETRAPVWQSGMSESVASAKDTWVLGVGPFQGGTIRDRTKFAGAEIPFGTDEPNSSPVKLFERPPVDYTAEVHFNDGWPLMRKGRELSMINDQRIAASVDTAANSDVQPANFAQPVADPPEDQATDPSATKNESKAKGDSATKNDSAKTETAAVETGKTDEPSGAAKPSAKPSETAAVSSLPVADANKPLRIAKP